MNKKNILPKILGLTFIFVLSIFVSACSFQTNKNILSIEIIETTIPQHIVVGEFDDAKIQAKITYDDNTFETIYINSLFLGEENKTLINTPGTYEVEILFRGVSTTITINIIDNIEQYTVKFFNGKNEIVSVQVVLQGQNAIEPSASACQINGYKFIGWDRTFDNVTQDINVYGIYVKIDNATTEDYSNILFNGLQNMMNSTLNISQIYESAIRYDTTMYYNNSSYDKLVIKRTDDGIFKHYEMFQKSINNNLVSYTRKYFSANGEITESIPDYYFYQYDIYAKIKKIATSATTLNYSKTSTPSRQLYSLIATMSNNDGENGNNLTQYEILFDSTQIISMKEYFLTTTGEKSLSGTTYYTINPTSEEIILYPNEVDLIKSAGSVFNYDVIVTKKEMRDYLCVVETITNDADNMACMVNKDNISTYVWCCYNDYNMRTTYYTKELLNTNTLPQVYKSNSSEKDYGNEYYYLVKNLFVTPSIKLDNNGNIVFVYNVNESSTSPSYNINFTISNGKLTNITKYIGSVIDYQLEFEYVTTEVTIPQSLINAQANAITE